ncbi:RNA exonuclease 4 OS=Cryptococcus neoformans var, neoformans serotype D (strain B-3501A) GN=REX4 PE=3 SV=1 [Rhizoctonia solani AG-1 IB]|uniref:RNA exonuclease 4 n=1 Tax=Thanatephorus cucumeris (strain AG1-IB / isolate 7/3/14) TaxID=1108050 RepID=A0A0B7FQC4_THACB|nr:RNA exonuclease 4 OS=Cryptococcus neoformans var, neoformans serotype D (strain B-3501A) GN=REX4 PE=3 SV=1 [Rhizoctonia solani AG-1 IB]
MAKIKAAAKKISGAGAAPGSNWLALKKKLPKPAKTSISKQSPKAQPHPPSASFPRGRVSTSPVPDIVPETSKVWSEEVKALQNLVLGKGVASESLVGEPGRYIAIDCEMVGVGENGSESSLARASIVDFQGRVVLDEFVSQRERVTDYRTQVSGVRPKDMINARSFSEVQAQIAALLSSSDRVLVGHALHNDLTALLLSHPAARIRDTQLYAGRKPIPGKGKGKAKEGEGEKTLWEKYRSPRIGLKRLVKEELGIDIQAGEHSSVTDARAAMAIYRLHKRAWDASLPAAHVKRARTASGNEAESGNFATDEDTDQTKETRAKRKRRNSAGEFPGGGRKGVSSGLGTIVKPRAVKAGKEKVQHGSADQGSSKWWQTLGGGQSKGKLTL